MKLVFAFRVMLVSGTFFGAQFLEAQTGTAARPPEPASGAIQLPGRVSPHASAQAAAITPAVQRKLDALRELDLGAARSASGAVGARAITSGDLLAGAMTKARANDLDAVEDFLTLTNPYEPGSAFWHLDAGQRFLDLAHALAKDGERGRTPAVVARTLQHFDTAANRARLAGDAPAQAAAKLHLGFVHERFRGDPEAAIDSYRAALQLQPNDTSAREALTRLERSLANLQARVRHGKR